MDEEYVKQLNDFLMKSTLTRQVANIGIHDFNIPTINQKLLSMAKDCYAHHTTISHILWDYMRKNGIVIKPEIDGLKIGADGFSDFAAYDSLMQQLATTTPISLPDLANQIISLVESAFQSAVRFTATSLKCQIDDLIDPLAGDFGILHTLAIELLSNNTVVSSSNYKNALVLWPSSINSDCPSLPLTQYDFSNPHMRYMPKSFVLATFENEDGELREGVKATIGTMEGTLISPNSPNAVTMVHEIASVWIQELRRDNEIEIGDSSPKKCIDDWDASSLTPKPKKPVTYKSIKRRNALSVLLLFVGVAIIIATIAISLQYNIPFLTPAVLIIVWLFLYFVIRFRRK